MPDKLLRKILLISPLTLLLVVLTGCSLPKRIAKKLEKQEFTKADSLLRKAWRKDSADVATLYLRSRLLLDTAYQQKIDSSHLYIDSAMVLFPKADKRQQKRLKRLEIDSSLLQHLAIQIDSAAFQLALSINTVASYQHFLDEYADAPQAGEATRLRNALAFKAAETENTWQAYRRFFQTYPKATEVAEARERYEELLFKERTQTGTLAAYRDFLAEHPETPYRERLLRNIFLLSTASHQIGDYRRFLNDYLHAGQWTRQAAGQLYYLDTTFLQNLPPAPWADSLQRAHALATEPWLAVLADEGWKIIDMQGKVQAGPFPDLHPDYRCEAIFDDVMEVMASQPSLLSRDGHRLLASDYESVSPLGKGLLLLTLNNRQGILHKNGRMLAQPVYTQIRGLSPQLFWLKQDDKQGLMAANGQWLLPLSADSVYLLGRFIIKGQNNAWHVTNSPALQLLVQQNKAFTPGSAYEQLRLLNDSTLLARRNGKYTLIGEQLSELLAPVPFPLSLAGRALAIEQDSTGYRLHGLEGFPYPEGTFTDYQLRYPWLALRDSTKWALFNLTTQQSSMFDSLMLLQEGVWYGKINQEQSLWFVDQDTTQLTLKPGTHFRLLLPTVRRSKGGYDLILTEGRQLQVYSAQGTFRFSGRFTDIQQPDSGIYVVKDRKGVMVVDGSGRPYVESRFSAAANYQQGALITLHKGQFGLLNPYKRIHLPPYYNAAPRPLNDSTFQVYRKKNWGLVNHKAEWLIPAAYDEVKLWNDSSAWVRKGSSWALLPFADTATPLLDDVHALRLWEGSGQQRYAIIARATGLGLVHNQRGIILEPTYDDLFNLGSAEQAVFYAEKEVKEANLHVVQYFNAAGEEIFQKAYTGEDWQKLYCD